MRKLKRQLVDLKKDKEEELTVSMSKDYYRNPLITLNMHMCTCMYLQLVDRMYM